MTRLLLIIILSTSVARAGLFDPIDVNKRAPLPNGQKLDMPTVEMPQLHFDNVSKQMVPSQPVATDSNKTADHGKIVDAQRINYDTLHYPRVPTKVVPQQNFTTKRAAINVDPVAQPVVSTGKADVTDHTIRPYTPAGEAEIRNQLRKSP